LSGNSDKEKNMPSYRRFAATLALLATCLAAPAVAAPKDDVRAYLDGLTTAKAPFRQIHQDGSVVTGTIYLHRPGRMRMEYDGPRGDLLIIGNTRVAIFDGAYPKNRPEQYPLHATPFGPLLARSVDLSDFTPAEASATPGSIAFEGRDARHPEYGTGLFSFSTGPVAMESWVMTSPTGEVTRVEFGQVESGAKLSRKLFSVEDEMKTRTAKK
jgi:outer membrane lipoprotein-sorting protein